MKDIKDQFASFSKIFEDALNTYIVTCELPEIQHLAQILLITEEA